MQAKFTKKKTKNFFVFNKQKKMTLRHLLFRFNLSFINPSIWSEYFKTSLKEIIISTRRDSQIIIPHHVLKGINSKEYDVETTEIALVITIITIKNLSVIEDRPATKHNTSSGKSGSKNIIDKIK